MPKYHIPFMLPGQHLLVRGQEVTLDEDCCLEISEAEAASIRIYEPELVTRLASKG